MRLSALLLSVVLMLPLAGCGGGGGGSSLPADARIYGTSPAYLGEFTASDVDAGLGWTWLASGEADVGRFVGLKGILRFTLDLPAGAEILEATLQLTQAEVVGAPYARFGDLMLNHARFGSTADNADYHAAVRSSIVLSTTRDLGVRTVSVLDQVREEMARGSRTLDFQLAFGGLSLIASTDFVRFGNLSPGATPDGPWLRIVYRMP